MDYWSWISLEGLREDVLFDKKGILNPKYGVNKDECHIYSIIKKTALLSPVIMELLGAN